ncbi:MAG: methyltransferase domain-containing protein, partial [Desulfobacteraceae bacterium]|nr:methyltransferase domain-containing protein [Desulfobacteraceae bacterium]
LRQCHQDGRGVALTHSNCVLTFADTKRVVGDFYNKAAQNPNTDISNPVCYPEETMAHVPAAFRVRSYGCGSPVLDAAPAAGQTVVDLGAGAGLECFIAARQVGKNGHVIGIDMLDEMICRAEKAAEAVAQNLGYRNVHFEKGFLEEIPLADQTADLVISNCVINLSEDKRKTFSEMMRVLKPGGRIVIADVVTDAQMPPEIANNEKLRGECIAGAMRQEYLVAMLEDAGFGRIQILKRFFYREVQNHAFYSLTYSARRPGAAESRRVIYPGPYTAAVTDSGEVLLRGRTYTVAWPWPAHKDSSVLVLDEQGNAENLSSENTCTCYTPPEKTRAPAPDLQIKSAPPAALYPHGGELPHPVDCMQCGKPLVYLDREEPRTCAFCGDTGRANAVCEDGHFVCDACHARDAAGIVSQICKHTNQAKMIPLLDTIRSHPAFAVHGPEHHFAVPAVIVAAFGNMGGNISDKDIQTAMDRGRSVPGGVCAFWGTCGAAVGVGIGFGVILQSNPLKPDPRQMVQKAVGAIIGEIAETRAGRCCRRESYTALIHAARWSGHILPIALEAGEIPECRQQTANRECIRQACPYAVATRQSLAAEMQ